MQVEIVGTFRTSDGGYIEVDSIGCFTAVGRVANKIRTGLIKAIRDNNFSGNVSVLVEVLHRISELDRGEKIQWHS